MSDASMAPEGVGEAGDRLWRAVTADFELAEHELSLLREAVRTADLAHDLQARVDEDGPVVKGRPNPLLAELRQQRILLARLLVALRIPIGDQETGSKTDPVPRVQRRGMRGAYGPRAIRSVG